MDDGIDWTRKALVVFDVDGTLYDQRALRLRMGRMLLGHTVTSRSIRTLRVLRLYRRLREAYGVLEIEDFEGHLRAETAGRLGLSPSVVAAIVEEWLEKRPLGHLAPTGYPGLDPLFRGLRRHGKAIGIFSDYPAADKLGALGLAADFVVHAAAEGVGALKPSARGLRHLMTLAGVGPEATLMVGDRPDRDGAAARQAGVDCLIRSARPRPGWRTFSRYDDPLFAPVLAPPPPSGPEAPAAPATNQPRSGARAGDA